LFRERPTQSKESGLLKLLTRYVIVAEKRQWSNAGTSLGTGGGVFFLYSSVLEAFFAWGLILKDCGRDMAAARNFP
jgi:hypothetical protein